MPLPYSYTPQSCRQRTLLPNATRRHVDSIALALGLAPTAGMPTREPGVYIISTRGGLRITYRHVTEPEEQIVITRIAVTHRRDTDAQKMLTGQLG